VEPAMAPVPIVDSAVFRTTRPLNQCANTTAKPGPCHSINHDEKPERRALWGSAASGPMHSPTYPYKPELINSQGAKFRP
jgi:hypothetical protein